MSKKQVFMDFLFYMDLKYGDWGPLPDNHPDIKKAQKLASDAGISTPTLVRTWTEERINYLKESYMKNIPVREIAKTLGITVKAVYSQAKYLKVKRSTELEKAKYNTGGSHELR